MMLAAIAVVVADEQFATEFSVVVIARIIAAKPR